MGTATLVPPLVSGIHDLTGYTIRGDVVAFLAAVVAATAIMMRSVDHREWKDAALHRGALSFRPLLGGTAIGTGAVLVTCGLLFALGYLNIVAAESGSTWLYAAVNTTLILALAGLAEEVMCRGYLLTVLSEAAGVRGAVIITSITFGLLHLGNPEVSAISIGVVILSGVLLAWVRLAFDSLYAAWLAHVMWNWVMAVPLHAPVSGLQFDSPGYRAVTSGPPWFSGGAWGPEGGLAAIIGMGSGIAYLYARHRREESKRDG